MGTEWYVFAAWDLYDIESCDTFKRLFAQHLMTANTGSRVFRSWSVRCVKCECSLPLVPFALPARMSPKTPYSYYFQVWGLSAHPKERLYATCGDDGSVRIWSLDDRRVVGSISTDCSCRALCYSPDGSSLAVSFCATACPACCAYFPLNSRCPNFRLPSFHFSKFPNFQIFNFSDFQIPNFGIPNLTASGCW